ncbi:MULTISPECIES: P-type DNA transfer ATPase VirB11 [unclassified Sphingomonas]|uniref:P-type DNA transfer ATPase VirB11 n=1 Tax=unclassified Sphingomonas TaxID=196159 RepID=UPI002269DED5|nr:MULTISPECIES: P-type DNA transfer ATPase VirB11 [unclassified Sphingomonas]
MSGQRQLLEHHLAPVRALMEPVDVTELVINRPYEAGVEQGGKWTWHEVPEMSFDWLMTLARAAAAATKQDIRSDAPLVSTVLPTGERCQFLIPPATLEGIVSVTMRKPSAVTLSLDDMISGGVFADTAVAGRTVPAVDRRLMEMLQAKDWRGFLELAVVSRKNILISGATGSGKTTISKALIQLIPDHERLLTIEDARELRVPHRNCVHMIYSKDDQGQAKIGPKQLLESALRMRPDRILLQELRDGTAFFYLRNVNSGHPGSITTVHANSAEGAFEQLTLLVKESEGGRDLGRDDIRGMLKSLIDVVLQAEKIDGRWRVKEVYFDPYTGEQPGS